MLDDVCTFAFHCYCSYDIIYVVNVLNCLHAAFEHTLVEVLKICKVCIFRNNSDFFCLFSTDSFVNSQEWTLSRSVPELKVVSLCTNA